MSDIPADLRPRLEVEELVSRIERQQEETRKFVAEQHKLMAEGSKLQRNRAILPWTVAATLLGAGAALFAAGAGFVKLIGG
jgi:hypothetical protein